MYGVCTAWVSGGSSSSLSVSFASDVPLDLRLAPGYSAYGSGTGSGAGLDARNVNVSGSASAGSGVGGVSSSFLSSFSLSELNDELGLYGDDLLDEEYDYSAAAAAASLGEGTDSMNPSASGARVDGDDLDLSSMLALISRNRTAEDLSAGTITLAEIDSVSEYHQQQQQQQQQDALIDNATVKSVLRALDEDSADTDADVPTAAPNLIQTNEIRTSQHIANVGQFSSDRVTGVMTVEELERLLSQTRTLQHQTTTSNTHTVHSQLHPTFHSCRNWPCGSISVLERVTLCACAWMCRVRIRVRLRWKRRERMSRWRQCPCPLIQVHVLPPLLRRVLGCLRRPCRVFLLLHCQVCPVLVH